MVRFAHYRNLIMEARGARPARLSLNAIFLCEDGGGPVTVTNFIYFGNVSSITDADNLLGDRVKAG